METLAESVNKGAAVEAVEPDEDLVRDLAALFDHYLRLQPGDSTILALWVLLTHTHDCHRNSPRLLLWSPTYGCGKTTALELLALLVRNPFPAVNATDAVLYRAPKLRNFPTMVLDECDTWLKNGRSPMCGVLNAGFGPKHTAFVPRMNMDDGTVENHPVFTPVVFASRLRELEGGLVRRSIKVDMFKAPPGLEPPEFSAEATEADVSELLGRIESWAEWAKPQLRDARPKMPPGIQRRDTWRPMFAIATLFGEEVMALLTSSAVAKNGQAEEELNVKLLRDVRTVFDRSGKPRLHSERLVLELEKMEDNPWSEVFGKMFSKQSKTKWLGNQLKAFQIRPEKDGWKEVEGDQRKRGYARAAFEPVWSQYFPEPTAEAA